MAKNNNIEVFEMNQSDPTKTHGFMIVKFCVFRWIDLFRTGGWVKNGWSLIVISGGLKCLS